jgi:hypothetical protein
MNNLNFTGLNPSVAEKIKPMVQDLLGAHASTIHSFHLVGSAVIPDYNEKLSDINSVVVLHSMDLKFVEFLAPLGKKYGKKHIAAPLVMTPEYIRNSLDAFPIEFLDFKLIHKTIYGEDLLKDLQVDGPHVRLQCEREIKARLIGLRQGYIASLGKKEQLTAVLIRSITGTMALFRAIILLLGKEPPIPRTDVIKTFGVTTNIDIDILENLLMLKAGLLKPSEQGLHSYFERYYRTLEATGKTIDEIPV